METFGEWLRQQRQQLKLTREQFADRVGCSVALLRKIEDGERRPSNQIAELMANCLNIPPGDRSTFVRVARGELNLERLSPELKPDAAAPPVRVNLPVLPTPLIGRQREVEELSRLLADPQCRLLTLVGPGGIGKTRLAIEAASRLPAAFADGVYFVPLAGVITTRFIVPLIAEALGFAFQSATPADPKTQLFRYLKGKQVLLLADNLEHLLTEPGIEVLAELLANAPQVKLLATSREPVGLQGEWIYEVQGLPIPDSRYAEGSAQNTGVELFLQRARRTHVGFTARPQDYPAIVRICQLVDGMPLGIELAAAWVRTLDCDEIAGELARGLDFLQVSARDLPARHRSMRAVFDHSWKLLTADEQGVLMRLSVFRGGFRREAAEQVAGAELAVLSALVTKSLIRRSGTGRYDLHEVILQFAAEQFAGRADEQLATQARHGRYYLTFFGQADARFASAAQQETFTELAAEQDNFRAAWDWAVAHGEFALIQQTMRTLWMYYDTRGWYHEGLDSLGRAVDALEMAHGHLPSGRPEQVALAHILSTRAWLAYRLADYEQAQGMLERSLAILRPLNETRVLVEALPRLGMLLEAIGNFARALELYSEGAELAVAIGDRYYAALSLTLLNALRAVTSDMVNPEDAYARLQAAVADCRRFGDPRLIGFGLRLLSQIAYSLRRYAEARSALEESVELNSSIGFGWGLGAAYRGLGRIAQAQDQHQQAVVMFRKALDTFTELGGSWWVARLLTEMSYSFFALGNDAEAESGWRESLRLATEIHGTPVALDALAGLASLQAKQGELLPQAFELLLIVLNHPACLQDTRDHANPVRAEVEAHLTEQQVEAAQTQARVKPLEQVVEQILQS